MLSQINLRSTWSTNFQRESQDRSMENNIQTSPKIFQNQSMSIGKVKEKREKIDHF